MIKKTKGIDFYSIFTKWWLSPILLLCSWLIFKQYYIAISSNIHHAIHHQHVFLFSQFYFVMDILTLIIHEAGHTIFGIFGWRFLTILGGTLMQLLIPFLIVCYGWFNKQTKITQSALYWLGFAWFDTAVYAADAYYKQLPLIGNLPASAHDFANLLSHLHVLDHYKTVAWFLFSIGSLVLLLAIIWPIFSDEDVKHVNLDLKI